jgi:hypothetical protein
MTKTISDDEETIHVADDDIFKLKSSEIKNKLHEHKKCAKNVIRKTFTHPISN